MVHSTETVVAEVDLDALNAERDAAVLDVIEHRSAAAHERLEAAEAALADARRDSERAAAANRALAARAAEEAEAERVRRIAALEARLRGELVPTLLHLGDEADEALATFERVLGPFRAAETEAGRVYDELRELAPRPSRATWRGSSTFVNRLQRLVAGAQDSRGRMPHLRSPAERAHNVRGHVERVWQPFVNDCESEREPT